MSPSDFGELKCTSRVRLFPLPLLIMAPVRVESSPSRSARIRYQRKVNRGILAITNRCIHTLNRMYSSSTPEPSLTQPPSASAASSLRSPPISHDHCQPVNSTSASSAPLPSGTRPVRVPRVCNPSPTSRSKRSLPVASSLPSTIIPSTFASRRQSRLLGHIWSSCASFALRARTIHLTTDEVTDTKTANVWDILASLPHDPHNDVHHRDLPNHSAPSSRMTSAAHPHTGQPSRVEPNRHIPTSTSTDPFDDLALLASVSTHSSASTAVVPLIASRVALPDQLNIVPLISVLPPDLAAQYADPAHGASLMRPELEIFALNQSAPLKPPRVAGSRSEYVRLIGRMVGVGMSSFTSQPKCVNGVFAVGKDEESDRLIIDAQPANRLFADPPHVALPDPSHLVQLRIPEGFVLCVGKSDLSNYYHHLGLPAWMQPYFALPPLTVAELASIGIQSSVPLYPMCLTLPMGFSHAVFLANTSHEFVVYSSGALSREDNLLRLVSPDVDSTRAVHGIVIDDFFLFSLNLELAQRIFDRVLAAYRAAGFVVKPSKVVHPTTRPVKVIGFMIARDPVGHTTIQLSIESALELARVTLAVLERGQVSGLGLAHVIGRWTWSMLLRRPSLAVLQHVYRYVEVAGRRRFTLWPSVRRELWMLLGLLPLLHARFDVPTFRHLIATDASELGGGVVCTAITPQLNQRVWPICSSRAHAYMQTICNALALNGHLSDLPPLLVQPSSAYTAFYTDVLASRWSTIISSGWLLPEHINVLELRAVLLAIHWLLSYPSSHLSRVYLLVDSTVALFALWKGRSSSAQLLLILRKINALLLASGVSLLTGWIPSGVNPADRPSRVIASTSRPGASIAS